MWIVHPQSVTHCQRRLAAKFQFIMGLSKADKQIMESLTLPRILPVLPQERPEKRA